MAGREGHDQAGLRFAAGRGGVARRPHLAGRVAGLCAVTGLGLLQLVPLVVLGGSSLAAIAFAAWELRLARGAADRPTLRPVRAPAPAGRLAGRPAARGLAARLG